MYGEHENRYGLRVLNVTFCQNDLETCCSTSLNLDLPTTGYLFFGNEDDLADCFHFPLEDKWSTSNDDFRLNMLVSYEDGESKVQARHWDIFYQDIVQDVSQTCVLATFWCHILF